MSRLWTGDVLEGPLTHPLCQAGSVSQGQAKIRRAVAGDFDGILRTDHHAASGDQSRADFLRRCLDLGECLVYLDHGSVAGFAVVRPAHFLAATSSNFSWWI